jgi:hypothetical protein
MSDADREKIRQLIREELEAGRKEQPERTMRSGFLFFAFLGVFFC